MDKSEGNYALQRYIKSLVEVGAINFFDDMNTLVTLFDPEKCPDSLLPYFLESFGFVYVEGIDHSYHRKFLANIGEVVKRRGTYAGVRYIAKVLTGMDSELAYKRTSTEVEQSRVLTITLKADSLEQLQNIDVSLNVVKKYLDSQLPFYITTAMKSLVVTVEVRSQLYVGGFIVANNRYFI